jgi:arsenate reductase
MSILAVAYVIEQLLYFTQMDEHTVLFLCQHGGAKSVVAASYFNRLAEQKGLRCVAVAAATEDPYPSVPLPIADLLERDGFDVRAFEPRTFEERDVNGAARVISIGCDLAGLSKVPVAQWNDVPQASEDLAGSVAAIRRHVEALTDELSEELRGRR